MHSSSNIFGSLIDDLKNQSNTTDNNATKNFLDPLTNRTVTDYSLILDSFKVQDKDVTITETAIGTTGKKRVKIVVDFSMLQVEIRHESPKIRFIDFQIVPKGDVRYFDAKIDYFFRDINLEEINKAAG